MLQAHHHSIGKSVHKDIVLLPLSGSAIEGKCAGFTLNHRLAHYFFQHLSFFLQPDIDTGIQGHFSHQQGDFDVIIMDGKKFLGVQGPFVRGSHQVDGVGVQELDTRHQTFTRLEGRQMGTDDEGVPILAQKPAAQHSQFCVSTPVSVGGCISIAPVAPISSITLSWLTQP